MVKFIFKLLILIIIVLGAVLLVRDDPGVVLVRYHDYEVETSLAFALVVLVVAQEDITDLPLEDQDHLVDQEQTPNHIDKDTLVVMQCQDIRHLTLVLEAAVQVVRALMSKMIR